MTNNTTARKNEEDWLNKRLAALTEEVQKRLVEQANARKTELILRLSLLVTLGTALASILLVAILWSVQDHVTLLVWLAILNTAIGIRMWVFHQYYRSGNNIDERKKLEKWHEFSVIGSTVVWGSGSILLMPKDSLLHQVVILTFVLGLTGGAVGVYLSKQRLMLWVVSLFLIPQAMWFISRGEFMTTVLGLGCLFYLITILRFSRALYERLNQNFLLSEFLEEEASTDALTGLPNRRRVEEEAKKYSEIAKNSNQILAVTLLDIDHFKKVNDQYGHDAGDRVLQNVAHISPDNSPNNAFCWRIGGEEFGVMWLAETETEIWKRADELRKSIEKGTVDVKVSENSVQTLKVTASFGVNTVRENLLCAIQDADQAMYQAKKKGRNRVVKVEKEPTLKHCA